MPKLRKRRLVEQRSAPQDDDEGSLSSSADSFVDVIEVGDNERPTPTSAAEHSRHLRPVQKNRGIDDDEEDVDEDELEEMDHRNYRSTSGNVKKDTGDRVKKRRHRNNLEKVRRKGEIGS